MVAHCCTLVCWCCCLSSQERTSVAERSGVGGGSWYDATGTQGVVTHVSRSANQASCVRMSVCVFTCVCAYVCVFYVRACVRVCWG